MRGKRLMPIGRIYAMTTPAKPRRKFGCAINTASSRVCEFGTKCCTVRHEESLDRAAEKILEAIFEEPAHDNRPKRLADAIDHATIDYQLAEKIEQIWPTLQIGQTVTIKIDNRTFQVTRT